MALLVSTGLVLALVAAGPALAQSVAGAQVEAPSARVFVDTVVREVTVEDDRTVAIMDQTPQSPCPSERYVYERERPKWLNTTGRIMEAKREGARLRISFSCVRGAQSINAIQFLTPPAAAPLPQGAARTRPVPLPTDGAAAPAAPGAVPVPLENTPQTVNEGLRAIPGP